MQHSYFVPHYLATACANFGARKQEDCLNSSGERVQQLVQALLTGNEERLEKHLGQLALQLISYHDGDDRDPEALYHGLLLGLCAALEPRYRVRSNRESGVGRPDLMILPTRPGQAGAVLELKVAGRRRRYKTLKAALAEGVAQLKGRRYDAELEAVGATVIQRWAVAFDGKRVKVVWVGLDERADTGE